ncbi:MULTISPECIES: dihydrolipoyl dehydrogenase [Metabacillus]|jgi:dihydrolipoamide dehydrogenase|uniref:Dihydrolipoyl dehydrogenase n=1 Tax=Metabacillus rhizolycopersici TaxID=2875709 RepID=A0ABS7UPV3_9BACI|nr:MULTISPECIES: dihydrolipoyl dehydrogenase [Metabacillus]MBZ5750337.1 dihydrolipoyl dehydrogenase [Metabacillus rhizolycopersici]MCM3654884.1 dihydrolipoyl dehydrogenase [Metabacillus litoralis]
MKEFDVIVIGAGPGGYVSAIRAAQLGKRVAIVEKKKIGGACLNVGCIPSKTLLKHSEMVEEIQKANSWGIKTGELTIDFPKLMKRKDQVVQTLTSGVEYLLKKNKITLFQGEASITEDLVVSIGNDKIKGRDILLATGSRPFIPPIKGLDKVDYLTTDSFFDLEKLPKNMVIIGGGVISVELAFAMAPLGTKVTIIEVAPDILLTEDLDARNVIKKQLQKKNIQTIIQADIREVKKEKVMLVDQEISYDTLLIATGRTPNIEVLQNLNIKMDSSNKFVAVDDYYETSKKHVYAVGDMIGGYQLAHAASAEGLVAVHAMNGDMPQTLQQTEIPRCVYTHPEIASFGLSEEQAKNTHYDVKVTISQLAGNGKAIAMGETEGFIKIISDTKYQEILGAVIVGANATELIGEILAMKHSEGTMNELASLIHAHPAVSEAIGESANALFQQAIHV